MASLYLVLTWSELMRFSIRELCAVLLLFPSIKFYYSGWKLCWARTMRGMEIISTVAAISPDSFGTLFQSLLRLYERLED